MQELREMRYIFSVLNRKDIFAGNFISSLAPLRAELKKLFAEWQPMLPVAWRSKGELELNPAIVVVVVVAEKFCIRRDFLASHLTISARFFIRAMIHFDTAAILDPNNPSDLFPQPRVLWNLSPSCIHVYARACVCVGVVTVFNLLKSIRSYTPSIIK